MLIGLPIIYWIKDGLKEDRAFLMEPVSSVFEYCFDKGRYHKVMIEFLQKDSKILICDVILIIEKNDQGWFVLF